MPIALHRFLLERIASLQQPRFTASELAKFPEAEVSTWLDQGILKAADPLRTVWKDCEDGVCRELEVFRHGEVFWGRSSDPGDPYPAVPLAPIDIACYCFSRPGLARAIAEGNGFQAIPLEEADDCPHIGDWEGQPVFLLQPVPGMEALVRRLRDLIEVIGSAPAVVVLPVAISLPVAFRKELGQSGIAIAVLGSADSSPLSLQLSVAAKQPDYSIEYVGDGWRFRFEGKVSKVTDIDAVRYVVFLLLNQGEEFSHLDIWLKVKPPKDPERFEEFRKAGVFLGTEKTSLSGIRQAEEIVANAPEAISSAKERGDYSLVDKLEEAAAQAEEFLKENRGRDGRPRKSSDLYDSARTTVLRGKKRCIELISAEEFGGSLARHLNTNIRPASKGHLLYNPSPHIDWVAKNIPKILL